MALEYRRVPGWSGTLHPLLLDELDSLGAEIQAGISELLWMLGELP